MIKYFVMMYLLSILYIKYNCIIPLMTVVLEKEERKTKDSQNLGLNINLRQLLSHNFSLRNILLSTLKSIDLETA